MASDTAPSLVSDAPRAGRVLPKHVGVIMDGNGRWAAARGKPRTEGHHAGVEALRLLIRLAGERGISFVTVFSFSSENWRRPKDEINFLFDLIRRFVASDLEKLVRNRVKVVVIGERGELDAATRALIDQVESRTRDGDRLQLNVAFNYGAQAELVRAVRAIAKGARDGRIDPEAITAELVTRHLYTSGIPDPDLILRTGGEKRLSNFLLWQSAYAEFIFVDEAWPEFNEAIFERVLEEFSRRQRRFGGLGAAD